MTETVQSLIRAIPLEELERIDIGLEGDWSGSVTTVWTRDRGLIGFERVARSHSDFRPSAELYLEGAWVGVQCYRIEGSRNVFDEDAAMELVRWVESGLAALGHAPDGGV